MSETKIPRCPHGCGMARHKGTCEEARQTLAECWAMFRAMSTELGHEEPVDRASLSANASNV